MKDEELLDAGFELLQAYGSETLLSTEVPKVGGEAFNNFVDSIDSEIFDSKILFQWIHAKVGMSLEPTLNLAVEKLGFKNLDDLSTDQFSQLIGTVSIMLAVSNGTLGFYVGWMCSRLREDGQKDYRNTGPDIIQAASADLTSTDEKTLEEILNAVWNLEETMEIVSAVIDNATEHELNLTKDQERWAEIMLSKILYLGIRMGQRS